MAIRPVDLQLAYLAGPQNAATVSSAQQAPQAAQQAAQSAFAAELTKREESVDEPQHVEGQKIRDRRERNPSEQQRRNGRRYPERTDEQGLFSPEYDGGEDEHLIDFTA